MVKTEIKLKTKRLLISPVLEEELRQMIAATSDMELRQAYQEMLDGCLENPGQWLWYTAWKICLKENGQVVGEACFKGPARCCRVEIGYGIYDGFCGKGYATEAIRKLTEWAFTQENVYFVEAETAPDNSASKRVLEKLSFRTDGIGKEGPRFVLKKKEMNNYSIIKIQDHEELLEQAAKWFHQKWGIPEEAYRESMEECLKNSSAVPQWYVVLDGHTII